MICSIFYKLSFQQFLQKGIMMTDLIYHLGDESKRILVYQGDYNSRLLEKK